MNSYFFPVSNEERENILDKHKHVYNGYRTLNPNPVSNEQPLFTQDFANDKQGLVVNNKGEVKAYTNVGINESKKRKPYLDDDDATDVHPHGESDWNKPNEMEESECTECWDKTSMEEDLDIGDVASSVQPAYQFQSDGPEDVYGTMDDYDSEHPHHDYNSMEDVEKYDDSSDINNMFGDLSAGLAFNNDDSSDTFQHDAGDVDREGDGGLGQDTEDDMDLSDVKPAYNFKSGGVLGVYEDNVEEEVDEDLKESFSKQRNLTLEMFQRMGKFL